MSFEILITFTVACVLLGLTPGPNMSLILANTLSHGLSAGLTTLAGTSTGLSLLVVGAVLGMSSAMMVMSQWFDIIRWVGALYLVYLGGRQVWLCWRRIAEPVAITDRPRQGWYMQGLLVSLSNPKVLLFLGAFLPQFVDVGADPARQLTVLALLFVLVLVAVDVLYTLAAARARRSLGGARLRLLDGVAGALLLLGGLTLAMVRRS